MTSKTRPTTPRSGFTLVEIIIVVVIIGLLAALAIPAFQKIRINANASRFAHDFRTFAGAFETHALELGSWPEDGSSNSLPVSAQPYLANTSWSQTPPNGGYWDWELNRFGFIAAIGLDEGEGDMDEAVFERVDSILDDGNLATGLFIKTGNRFLYVLQRD